jgi:hypothetical protein
MQQELRGGVVVVVEYIQHFSRKTSREQINLEMIQAQI